MVTIINGEIVPDNDPRAQAYWQRKNNSSARETTEGEPRQTSPRNQTSRSGQRNGTNVQNGGSMFYDVNNRLLEAGIPRLTFAGRVFEPLVLIGIMLAVIFLGLRGLMLIGLIYFLINYAGGGTPR